MLNQDHAMNIIRLEIRHDTAERDFFGKAEDCAVLEGFIILQPDIDRLSYHG